MEVLSEQPTEAADSGQRSEIRLGEMAPNPLMYAGQALRSAAPEHFPRLYCIRFDSAAYEDEQLWLSTDEAADVLRELRRLRKVCQREVFIPGVDGAAVYERWRDWQESSSFEKHLDELEHLLSEAVDQRGGVLLLL